MRVRPVYPNTTHPSIKRPTKIRGYPVLGNEITPDRPQRSTKIESMAKRGDNLKLSKERRSDTKTLDTYNWGPL